MEKLWQPPQEEHNKLGDRSPIALARVGGDNNFKVLRGSPWGSRGDLRLQDLPGSTFIQYKGQNTLEINRGL
ncbi:hypothetical protein Y1Q_0000975 [Alligator mississippiensis]|uniref:Uncharacterized protein n=1 Tax=Alligator mississippiensis TaxID=8496 RepID=A0A151NEC3_ALLMI|nr:hypothetical protein Y1Q_0000975 [Alligator mississippiensis]